MKTLNRIKILSLGVFTTIMVSFPLLLLAAPWSEQNAFCLDRATNSTQRAYSNYEQQKIYNKCMDNADSLIAEYGRKVEAAKAGYKSPNEDYYKKLREFNQNPTFIRKKTPEEVERQKLADKRIKLLKDQEIKKYDDLFSEF